MLSIFNYRCVAFSYEFFLLVVNVIYLVNTGYITSKFNVL